MAHAGPHAQAPWSVRRQRELGENVGMGLYCDLYGKKQVRKVEQFQLALGLRGCP